MTKGRLSACAVVLVLAALAFSLGGTARGQSPPPSLQGEAFVFSGAWKANPEPTCLVRGGGSVDFSIPTNAGAFGPYIGTFGEVLRAQFDASNAITVLTASFGISAPNGEVRGTKMLIAGGARCANLPDGTIRTSGGAAVTYEATITTADGTFHDSGTASLTWDCTYSPVNQTCEGRFTENFLASSECPANDDADDDGLNDHNERIFGTLLGDHDSDDDGVKDGNEDSDGDGEDDEDEDDDDECPDEDDDDDGEDDEDEDDD